MKSFVLSDESINSYGFRVLTDGIDLTDFKRNPIMFWNHIRSQKDSENVVLPIGKWVNIRVEDKKLLADADFDMEDEFAAKIAKKVEKGIINMASIGISKDEESDRPEHILPGQTRKTITKSKLKEASITDIGSNSNAVRLFDENGNVELSATGECSVGFINNTNKNQKIKEMKKIALSLGLAENASEQEITSKIEELKSDGKAKEQAETIEKLTARVAELEKEKKEASEKAIETLVDNAVGEKKITADKKSHFVAIGKKIGVEELKTTLSCMNAGLKPNDIITGGVNQKPSKKYSEMSEQELLSLRNDDMKAYEALYEAEFGFKPEIN